jgi:ribosomal protein L11 methyltransferase
MLALVVSVPAVEAELAADALWALGVAAVEERDPGDGTEDQVVELWTSLGDDAEAVTRAAEGFPARWRWRTVEIDPAVLDEWRRHAVPTWVAKDLVLRPEWVDVAASPDVTVVSVEPGGAFGLGDHPTTVLTLRGVRRALFPGATVLDVGCGSGVVAVTSCLLGAARAEAIDISPAAIDATRHNARANGVEAQVNASLTSLEHVTGTFDVVAANILGPVLVSLAADLRRVLAPGGVLVVSGVLESRYDHVVTALEPLHLVGEDHREGWAALSLRH